MTKPELMILGFIDIVTGFIRIVSFGFLGPRWDMKFAFWTAKRKMKTKVKM